MSVPQKMDSPAYLSVFNTPRPYVFTIFCWNWPT